MERDAVMADDRTPGSPEQRQNLIRLLRYAEELLRIGSQTVSDLSEHAVLSLHEQDMRGLDGVTLAPADGAWMRFARLRAHPEAPAGGGGETPPAVAARQRGIAVYNDLYAVQQRMAALGDDVPEEAILGIGMARWRHPAGRVNIPLIEAAVDIALSPEDGALVVAPRRGMPKLCLRAFADLDVPNLGLLIQQAGDDLARRASAAGGFSPFDRAIFEPVLRACAARLSGSAIYEPDAGAPPGPPGPASDDGVLRISDGWVLYVRRRSIDARCDDIGRLIDRIAMAPKGGAVPVPALRLANVTPDQRIAEDPFDASGNLRRTDPPAAPRVTADAWDKPARGDAWDKPAAGLAATRTFFPLPSNDEQAAIMRRLEDADADGVLVQGPPGTGKTHTIANIIAHTMATGRRVLVTARTPEALTAIQEKLPPQIRDFAIAAIHSDHDGARQLEQAVELLASQVKDIDLADYRERCVAAEHRLDEIAAEIAGTDRAIEDLAGQNLRPIAYRGRDMTPMALAQDLHAERARHAWLTDALGPEAEYRPRFSDADIIEARDARARLGADIGYLPGQILAPDSLPDGPRLQAAHEALVRLRRSVERAAGGSLPPVALDTPGAVARARVVRDWLDELAAWFAAAVAPDAWLADLYRTLATKLPDPSVAEMLQTLALEWTAVLADGRGYEVRGFAAPGPAPGEPLFDAAIAALAAGRKPIGRFAAGRSRITAQLAAVRLEQRAPRSVLDWSAVVGWRRWQRHAHGFIGRWCAAAGAAGLPALPQDWEAGGAALLRIGGQVERMLTLLAAADARGADIRGLFPHGLPAARIATAPQVAALRDAVAVALDRADSADAVAMRADLAAIDCAPGRPLHTTLADLRARLGDPAVSPYDLAEAWRGLLADAQRLTGKRAAMRALDRIAATVEASGAAEWAARLRSEPVDGAPASLDPLTPDGWAETWAWARAAAQVRGLADRARADALAQRRLDLEGEQRQVMAETIRLRTFIGLKARITTDIARALARFVVAVRMLGAGTGSGVERRRRAVREAALDAAAAVPCWILPEWRVAEQLPSEPGLFDLVIIDEASQSDITALPAVVRGRKLLVVGDDRQVAPSAVGIDERSIVVMRETLLRGSPLANDLDPTTSIYDLAAMMFTGTTLMLREHFRCVEPIISFSSRLCYRRNLVPLRLPTPAERLDPPLVDVHVAGGRKVAEVNEAEAAFIVAEIGRLVADAAFAGRSIGVISLIGDKQARRIGELLAAELGLDVVERHRITCGNAATFQGQERDIMFLSMVACPETARAQTSRTSEQRFNVAMSRARDRVYLVRSVTAEMLAPGDLKRRLIEHVQAPLGDDAAPAPGGLDACETELEREVAGCLLVSGYRLRPHLRVGRHRIDLVVEGEGDRRLGIMLDGDTAEDAQAWLAALSGQRALQRAGWRFWQCWGAQWAMDREACLRDLLATLGALGIAPLADPAAPMRRTETREIGRIPPGAGTSPFQVAAKRDLPAPRRTARADSDASVELAGPARRG